VDRVSKKVAMVMLSTAKGKANRASLLGKTCW